MLLIHALKRTKTFKGAILRLIETVFFKGTIPNCGPYQVSADLVCSLPLPAKASVRLAPSQGDANPS